MIRCCLFFRTGNEKILNKALVKKVVRLYGG